jgi:hypothetical protein
MSIEINPDSGMSELLAIQIKVAPPKLGRSGNP